MEVRSAGETVASSVSQTHERKRHESSQHLVLALPVLDGCVRGCYVLSSTEPTRRAGLEYRWWLPLVYDARHHRLARVSDIANIES